MNKELEEAFNNLNFAVSAAEEKMLYNNLEKDDLSLVAKEAENYIKIFRNLETDTK